MKTWRRLLTGAAGEKAAAIAVAVADDIADRLPIAELARRDPLVTLLFAYLGRFTGERRHTERAEQMFDEASQDLGRFDERTQGLFGGLAGVVWLDAHLDRYFAARDPDPANDEDDDDADPADHLARFLDLPAGSYPYELISGLAGFGVTWLERLPKGRSRAQLARLVEVMEATAIAMPEGLAWHTPVDWVAAWRRPEFPTGYVDLGVAHGMAGMLVVLARIGAAGIARATCERLVEGGFAWLLAQRLPGDAPWLFPSQKTEPPTPALPAVRWCYAGLGTGGALLASARLLGSAPLEDQARIILRSVAAERDGRTVDAGLCHGFAGNGHIFHRAFQLTGDPVLEDAARFWLGRALDKCAPGQGIGGYLFWGIAPGTTYEIKTPPRPPEGGWKDDPSWLNGSAGTALALLAAVDDRAPAWDALLALSG